MDPVSVSKFLSLVLRHQPERIGLVLDAQGWARIDALVERASAHGRMLSRELIETTVRGSDKQRFALSDDGSCIRANQGHSLQVDLALVAQTPPTVLYHGTATRFTESIRIQGLLKRNRQHVHLSFDAETALKVGSRHGDPVVLHVRASRMHARGHVFLRADNGVWLTDAVAPEFIDWSPEA